MNRILTAILDTPRRVIITDVVNGATVNMINLEGDIISGPMVVGDTCTITIQLMNMKETRVYRMETGALTNKFTHTA